MFGSDGLAHLTVVTAPAGTGKTRWIAAATARIPTVWLDLRSMHHGSELAQRLVDGLRLRLPGLSPALVAAVGPSWGPASNADPVGRSEQLGSLIGRELDSLVHHDLALVIDEVERFAGDAVAMRLLESLVRSAPSRVSIVLAGRVPVPFAVSRFADDDELRQIGPDDLRLNDDAARAMLVDRWPELDEHHDAILVAGGGVAGTLLTLAAAAAGVKPERRAALLATCAGAPDPVIAARGLVIEELSDDARALLSDVAVLGAVHVADLERLGHVDVAGRLGQLLDAGLVDAPAPTERVDRVRLGRGVRPLVDIDQARRRHAAAFGVRAAAGRGDAGAALAIARKHADRELVLDTVRSLGDTAIATGLARLTLDVVHDLDEPVELLGLAGRAHQALGDWESAIAAYRRAAEHRVRAADAWRHVLLEYFQGNTLEATRIAARAHEAADPDDHPVDRAMLLGYAGSAAWITGDIDTARERAHAAMTLATAVGDDAALAVSHTLAAMVAASDGDRVNNDWYYVRALQHAERAGDALQIARIRSNQASRLMEEGDYEAALAELDDAVRYADLGGYGVMLGLALSNRGEVLTRLGRLDDAHTDLRTATDLLQRQGSRVVAYPLVCLARLFRIRGDIEQARGCCERAVAISDPAEDQQLGVAVQVELALVLAERQPELAWEYARQAAEASTSLDAAHAWSVVGLLAVGRGEFVVADDAAQRAAELARSRRDRFALGRALEVMALTATDPVWGRQRLEEAYTLFDDLRCVIDAAEIELRLLEDRLDAAAVARVAAVGELARRLGARPLLAKVERLLGSGQRVADAISVSVLGGFGVRRGDLAIPLTAWQSKKARDLFKMLVTRRGRPLPREQALDRLWPEDDPAKASSKLSVALATVRGVLDPDKLHASDYYVRGDAEALTIDRTTVVVDVDRLVEMATEALAEHRRSAHDRATAMLAAAEAAYTGEVLEEDPYVDWYVSVREESRMLYLDVTRALADRRLRSGDIDDAVRLLLRVLEREPYDEQAHIDLVVALSRVGRHGDARRRYQQYTTAMRELDIEPRAFPKV